MPFKDFSTGNPLLEGDLDTYLMQQAVIRGTVGTRPTTVNDGMLTYATDRNAYEFSESGVWTSIMNAPEMQVSAVVSSDDSQWTSGVNHAWATVKHWAAPSYASLSGFSTSSGLWTAPYDMDVLASGVFTTSHDNSGPASAVSRLLGSIQKNGSTEWQTEIPNPDFGLNTVVVPARRVTVSAGDTLSLAVYMAAGSEAFLEIYGFDKNASATFRVERKA